jgi:hypothetical protein
MTHAHAAIIRRAKRLFWTINAFYPYSPTVYTPIHDLAVELKKLMTANKLQSSDLGSITQEGFDQIMNEALSRETRFSGGPISR